MSGAGTRTAHGISPMFGHLGTERRNLLDLDALGLAFEWKIIGQGKTARRALLRTMRDDCRQILFLQLDPLVSGVARLSSALASRQRTFRTWGCVGRIARRRARRIAGVLMRKTVRIGELVLEFYHLGLQGRDLNLEQGDLALQESNVRMDKWRKGRPNLRG